MPHGTEHLSLGEVEDLARDALTRAGVDRAAAAAAAWAIQAAERDGDPAAGLARLPRLLEGVRMGSIAPHAQVHLHRPLASQLSIDAMQGLSDAAVETAFATLVELAKSNGAAVLTVVRTGDIPMPMPWVKRLADHDILGLASALPQGNGPQLRRAAAGDVGLDMLTFLTGGRRRSETEDAVPLAPSDGSLCILALARAQIPTGDGSMDATDGRQEADTTGVDVSAELLVRILT